MLDVVLRKGDFLYAPRGTIHQVNVTNTHFVTHAHTQIHATTDTHTHQCVACPGADSLHVTISTGM